MKRGILLCLLALLLLLTACGGETSSVYEQNGYTVDLENRTITHGEDVYTFFISDSGSGSEITITYPNGATYHWTWTGSFGHGGGSADYDPDRYADGDTLKELLNFEPEPEKSGPSPLLAVLLLAAGIFNLVSPRTAWYLSYGWRFKNAEPSDAALVLGRLGGGLVALISVFLLIASL